MAGSRTPDVVVAGETIEARLHVFPRLDLVDASAAPNIDELLHTVKHLVAEVFDTEEGATEFYKQHPRMYNPPVFLSPLTGQSGSPFTGRRFSEYHTAPAETWGGVALDFLLDDPIRCTLAEDWQFRSLEIRVNQKTSHKTVRRYPAHPERELREALDDVEAELYQRHAVLTTHALRDFWSSFEIHKLLTLHAVKMERYHDEYSGSITQALDYMRRHIADYVTEVLDVDSASGGRKPAQDDLARKIQSLKADWGATVEELEALFNLDRKTLRRLERGEPVRQSTIDKAPASRDTLDRLRSRLIENRARKHQLN